MAKVSDPITINKTVVKNRITMAPTVKFDMAGADGKVTPDHVKHYKERAEHGCGLICVEATAVTPDGRFCKGHMGLWEDGQIDGHKAIADACHEYGAVSIIQINHTGISANPECGPAVGPSSVPTRDPAVKSHEMTTDEIHKMQEAFVRAAIRAQMAGYDGIQLHGCHGYLINQFMSKKVNFRTDEYGGSDENRARFGSEIIEKIRKECGEDYLISVRISGYEPDVPTAINVAEEYVKAGCDYLQVSFGLEWNDAFFENVADRPYNNVCDLGVRFHDHFRERVPVSCVNSLFEPEPVRYLIENDLVDTVDLGRPLLADPAFAEAILNGTPYVKCFNCKACQYGPFTAHRCPALAVRSRN